MIVQRSAFRHKRNWALGLASEVAAPLLRPLASLAANGSSSEPGMWKRGLILSHNHIGDVLCRTASLSHLRKSLPDCEWSILTTPSSAEVLRGNPYLREILPWSRGDDSWNLDASHRDELVLREFDAVLCTNTLRHYPDFLLATRLGIPNRVGFTFKGLSGLINHPVAIDFPSPYAGYFRTMVAAMARTEGDWPLAPEIFLDDADATEAENVLGAAGVNRDVPLLSCSLSTRQSHGNWPVNSMVDVIREARRLSGLEVVLCGTQNDAGRLHEIARGLDDDVKVIAGKVSVRGFAAILERSAALFTLDSGPRHIGNAVRIPVVFARNMSHSQAEAGRYCVTETDIAPAGEYLSDAQIERVAAGSSAREVAEILVTAIASGARRA